MENTSNIAELLEIYKAGRASKSKDPAYNVTIEDGTGHAVGYTRVSTHMQANSGSSMETQKEAIERYCEYKGLILDKVYEEPAKSGADNEREQLSQLISDLKPNMKVIIYSIDRMSRDTKHLLEMRDTIHSKGCTIYFLDRQLDSGDTSTEMVISIMAAVATEQRKAQNRNISYVMQSMSENGTLRTRPKYGWKVINKSVVEDPEEQAVISIIRNIIIEDPKISLAAICRRLKHLGIKIRNSKDIYPTTVKNIIDYNEMKYLRK